MRMCGRRFLSLFYHFSTKIRCVLTLFTPSYEVYHKTKAPLEFQRCSVFSALNTNFVIKKLLFDKLEVNKGMLVENIVAQMLTAGGHKLYFYSNPSRNDSESRMEIDFLIVKSKINSRHNISPIEVKSGRNYTLTSLRKFMKKYAEQADVPYVLHTKDLKVEEGIVFLPLYMTPLL